MNSINFNYILKKRAIKRLLSLAACLFLVSCQSQETEKVFVPAVQSQQGAVDSEQETVNSEQLAVDSEQSTVVSEQPTVVSEPLDAQQPAAVEPTANSQSATADADVLFVDARQTGKESWTFSVKVQHPDTGWEDYADGWDVVLPDGSVAKPDAGSPFTRLLLHPHVGEQTFTRSQSNITIPADVTAVSVRAHDLVDGFGGREVVVDLTAVSGSDFSVLSEQ